MDNKKKKDEGKKEDVEGEALAYCSDREWEQSESAYSADLLNVKKKPNQVTVFSAPEKIVDSTGQSIRQMPVVREIEESDPRVKGIARLVAGVTKTLLDDEQSAGVQVTVTLKLHPADSRKHIQ